MFCISLFPTISHPTRIEVNDAVIDNIFSYDVVEKILRGITMNDINDHLPFFFDVENRNIIEKDVRTSRITRCIRHS